MIKSIDIVGIPSGVSGFTTHCLEFARAMRRLTSVNFRSRKKHLLPHLFGADAGMMWRGMTRGPGIFSVVVEGNPLRKTHSARWIVWETSKLPRRQHELCESVDYLWSPSKWGREILVANGYSPDRIHVVPEGVNTKFFSPGPPTHKTGVFRFLMVGKWEERKNCQCLLRAFTREFRPDEPVELYLQAHNAFVPGFSLAHRVAATGVSNDHSVLLGAPCSLSELRDLYRSADCFVLPTRAEGWGLPILEAMACGIPAIVTRYSAPVDYVNDANGYLIDVARMVEARDDDFDVNTGHWAEADERHLRFLMREAFQNREERLVKGQLAARDAQSLSWDGAALKAIQVIEQLLASRRSLINSTPGN